MLVVVVDLPVSPDFFPSHLLISVYETIFVGFSLVFRLLLLHHLWVVHKPLGILLLLPGHYWLTVGYLALYELRLVCRLAGRRTASTLVVIAVLLHHHWLRSGSL